MKKSILILLLSFGLLSLNSCKDEATTVTNSNTEKKSTTQVYEEEWRNTIVLNNGKQWAANKETTDGILLMQALIKRDESKNLQAYKELATDLDRHKTHIVKKCSMTGASHDNLHVYLIPLIKKINSLSEAESTAEAEEAKQEIEKHLALYFNYFK